MASAIAFQAFFSLFPLVLLMAALIGFASSDEVNISSAAAVLGDYLPASSIELLTQALTGLARERTALG
jgi:uncharacterized BrkB/YihY/UPF0761 family membrane protein